MVVDMKMQPPNAGVCRGEAESAAVTTSIVVPTLNEASNLDLLLMRINQAMAGRSYEVLIVDDGSVDGTAERCLELADDYPLRVFSRSVPMGGLSGAVLHGFNNARGVILLAMDGDLQHPPEAILSLISPLLEGEADFVLGSRYAAGGIIASEWSMCRRIMSWIARALCRPLIGGLTDPMSGFFALPRTIYDSAHELDPVGYKVALEVICKCEIERILEIPIRFDVRARGRSKLSVVQQWNYLRHLSRLYRYRFLALPASRHAPPLSLHG